MVHAEKQGPSMTTALARLPHLFVALEIGADLPPSIPGNPDRRRSRRNGC